MSFTVPKGRGENTKSQRPIDGRELVPVAPPPAQNSSICPTKFSLKQDFDSCFKETCEKNARGSTSTQPQPREATSRTPTPHLRGSEAAMFTCHD